MKRATCLLFMLSAVACRQPPLQAVDGELGVTPEQLDFGQVERGARATRELTLHNRGRTGLDMSLSAPAEVSLSPATLRLEAGASSQVSVSLHATTQGTVAGQLEVRTPSTSSQVPYAAHVIPVEGCPAPSPCQEAVRDAQTGACGTQSVADGTSCPLLAEACGTTGACRAGACVPQEEDCSDGNACTEDRCVPGMGCTHDDSSTFCQTEDPCRVAVCDAQQGCTTVAANEGQACGSADCIEAHVCRAGVCVAEAVAEGSVCGTPSPCQPQGRCEGQVCVRPEARPLEASWEYPYDAHYLPWSSAAGVFDARGRLYWMEPVGLMTELRSVEPAGEERLRVMLPGDSGQEAVRLLVHGAAADQQLAVGFSGRLRVQVRSLEDGTLRHDWDLDSLLQPQLYPSEQTPPAAQARAQFKLVGGTHVLYVVVNYYSEKAFDAHEYRGSFIVALGPSTGEVLWTQRLAAGWLAEAPVVDAQGGLSVLQRLPALGEILVAYDASGVERFRIANPGGAPMAAQDGRLYLSEEVHSQATGELLRTPLILLPEGHPWVGRDPRVLVSETHLWGMMTGAGDAPHSLVQASVASGRPVWVRELEGAPLLGINMLMAEDEQILVFTDAGWQPGALEWPMHVEGTDRFGQGWSCRFDNQLESEGVGLGEGYFVTREVRCDNAECSSWSRWLRGYAVPGLRPQRTGWVHPSGNPGQAFADTW